MGTILSRTIIRLLVIVLLLTVPGCGIAVMEASQAAYNHLRGDLVGIVPYPVETVYPITVTVVKKIDGYNLTGQRTNFLNAQVLAYDQTSRKVEIDLSRTEHNQTKIQIRIGLIGDEMQSAMIFNRVVNKLSEDRSDFSRYAKQQPAAVSYAAP